MRQLFIFTIAFLACTCSAGAQNTFQKKYGGTGPVHTQPTYDGGFVLAGTLNDTVYVIKTDAQGNTSWAKTVGFKGTQVLAQVKDIQQLPDSTFLIGGATTLTDSTTQVQGLFLLKLNALGQVLWLKSDGALCITSMQDAPAAFTYTAGQGFAIAGVQQQFCTQGNTHIYLYKANATGKGLWMKTYATSISAAADVITSLIQTSDGGYLLGGNLLIKTDSKGDTLWTKQYGTTIRSLQQTADGGYILAGSSPSMIKITSTGVVTWSKTYGSGTGTSLCVKQLANGGYLLSGETVQLDAQGDAFALKTNATGDTVWTKTFGGSGTDYAGSIAPCADKGYVLGGFTHTGGLFLMKLDSMGAGACSAIPNVFAAAAYSPVVSGAPRDTASLHGFSAIAIQSHETNYSTGTDFCFSTGIAEQSHVIDLQVYPNPSGGLAELSLTHAPAGKLKVRVFNVLGETVYTLTEANTHTGWHESLDLQALPNGSYFVQVEIAGLVSTGKLVIVK